MTTPTLLQPDLRVATAGVEAFDADLAAQGVTVTRTDWRPPLPGTAAALATLALDAVVAEANEVALGRLLAARPMLVDVVPAAVALGLERDTFLHAGPPQPWERAAGPLRGALIGAALFEGVCADSDEAATRFAAGSLRMEPCHGRGAVGPMAGVVAASMPMLVVEDPTTGRRAHCSLNEGLGKVLRFGAYGPDVLERLGWMAAVLGPRLADVLQRHGPLDVFGLVAQALQMGDEGHNRNRAATSLFLREIVAELFESDAPSADIAAVLRFVTANDHFFLNIVMAAAKCAADGARDVPGSSLVVAMARNGTDFGVQLSGTGDRWFTAPATIPRGLLFPGFTTDDANPDLGDSTITETVGLGGFAMAAAPAIVNFVGGHAADALAATARMAEITLAEHPLFGIPALDGQGAPVGLDATLVVRTGIAPVVNTGIAGKVAGTGQIGAGLVTPPLAPFAEAVVALAERVGGPPTPG